MKIISALLISLFSTLFVLSTFAQDARAVLFDKDWRFKKDSLIKAESPAYSDADWRKLNLPHDWGIEDLPNQKEGSVQGPFIKASIDKGATGYTEGGIGWYRKTFTLNKSAGAKHTYITFEGVYMDADVWVNGKHVGNHPYVYTSFSYDITNYLNPEGKLNVIAVRAKSPSKSSRWYTGSGIYLHVWLTTVGNVHTEIYETYVTTPVISANSASVKVENSIRNTSSQEKQIDVMVNLLSPAGLVVATQKQTVHIPANNNLSSAQLITVSKPALWSLESPVLYKVKVTLLTAGKTIDQTTTSFGIRSIEFDGQKGFLLNGKMVKLKGGCIHHDNGLLGAAAFDRAEERKIELLKKAGYNALRLSHNPMSPALLNACDRIGMLVVTDAFDM